MKRTKLGIAAVVITVLAITVAVVGAQPPAGNGSAGGIGGQRQGQGIELQVVADTLGVDLQTLQTDLQNGETISDVATAQNVELSTIIDAVIAKRTEALTQSVTDGTLTQEQADAQLALTKANLNADLTKVLQQPTQPTNPQTAPQQAPQGDPSQRQNDQMTVIAAALNIDVSTLQSDLQNGQTVADIATAQNVELSKVVDAVVAARQTTLTAAVTAGTLTQEQADAQIQVLKANLDAQFVQKWDANANRGPGVNFPGGNPPGQNGNGAQPPAGNPPTGSSANPPVADGSST